MDPLQVTSPRLEGLKVLYKQTVQEDDDLREQLSQANKLATRLTSEVAVTTARINALRNLLFTYGVAVSDLEEEAPKPLDIGV